MSGKKQKKPTKTKVVIEDLGDENFFDDLANRLEEDDAPATKTRQHDWYDEIDAEIRPVVRLLRDNGYNTTYSCGELMHVDLDMRNLRDAESLAALLIQGGYAEFSISATVTLSKEGSRRNATVRIQK